MAKYYISDIHGFHKNVCREGKNFDNRPFDTLTEMHDVIFKNINTTCNRGDDLYILGDFVWKVNDDSIAWVSKMKPNLHLITGNHDKFTDSRYTRLFSEIIPYKEVTDNFNGKNYNLVLSHFPIYSWNGMHKNWIHLYGHVHDTYEEIMYKKALKELNDYYKNRDGDKYKPFFAYNVGCMQSYMNYIPRTLQEILDTNNYNVINGDK